MLENLPTLLLEKISDGLDFKSQLTLTQICTNIRRRNIKTREIWINGLISIYGKEAVFNYFFFRNFEYFGVNIYLKTTLKNRNIELGIIF